jgi:hypothetical protein
LKFSYNKTFLSAWSSFFYLLTAQIHPRLQPVRDFSSFRQTASDDSFTAQRRSSSHMDSDTPHSSSGGGTAELNKTMPSLFTKGKPQMPRRGRKADILQAMSAKNEDIPPTPKARRKSRGKSPRQERATPLLAPVQAPYFPANDVEDDEDGEKKSSLCTSSASLKPIREGQYASSSFQSSFSCVFGASQDCDFPLAHPSRCLSPPLVSPTGSGNMLAVLPAAAALLSLGTGITAGTCSLAEL